MAERPQCTNRKFVFSNCSSVCIWVRSLILRYACSVNVFVSGCLSVESLRFLALGDWGGLPFWPYATPIEMAVGEQMGKITTAYQTSFNLALGDNFYFDGVTDVEDKRFFVGGV